MSYGPVKEAELHYHNRRKPARVLTGDKFNKIKKYIERPTENDNWCERIEIRIPNNLLKVKKKTFCVCTIKVTEVLYVCETIWYGRATISGKKLKKIKGLHLIKPCWRKSYSLSQTAFFLRFLLYKGIITSEVIGHVPKQIKG